MTYQTLLYEVDLHVAMVTLNRPKLLNALSAQVFNELEDVFTQVESNSQVRAVLITGAGDRSFAAGADINELARTDARSGEQTCSRGQAVFGLIESCRVPVIALINGFALGGGCELAMACTMRLASDRAKLGQPEVKLGLIPGYGGTQRLPRLVGQSQALRLLLTGDMIEAGEALRIGLVDLVFPGEVLMARGQELAAAIANGAPLAVRDCLRAVRDGSRLPLHEGMQVEAELFGALCSSQDKAEGMSAFLKKRPPVWHGR